MASTQQLRDWWDDYECKPGSMERYPFPSDDDDGWANLLVAAESIPVWAAASQIMETEPYLFRESSGGTYNCRPIGSSGRQSLHSYGIALDLNPKKNPHRSPLTTDMADTFIARMEGIRANGKKALVWGGRWSKPDAMHYQLDVGPHDCVNVTWDKGEEMAQAGDGPNGEPNWDEVSDWAQKAWSQAHLAGILTDSSHPRDSLEVEQLMVYLDRAKVI